MILFEPVELEVCDFCGYLACNYKVISWISYFKVLNTAIVWRGSRGLSVGIEISTWLSGNVFIVLSVIQVQFRILKLSLRPWTFFPGLCYRRAVGGRALPVPQTPPDSRLPTVRASVGLRPSQQFRIPWRCSQWNHRSLRCRIRPCRRLFVTVDVILSFRGCCFLSRPFSIIQHNLVEKFKFCECSSAFAGVFLVIVTFFSLRSMRIPE